MILHGNQRGGAANLARHLLNTQDNEHVSVHEVRGFMASDVMGAFREIEAVSKATRCKQYLFSLSFNPPEGADASLHAFEAAFEQAEEVLGLENQPRVIVFHEKHGRRHAHVVWSRIDTRFDDPRHLDAEGSESIRQTEMKMKAVNMAFSKRKLFALSRDLFIQHGWELPRGYLHLGGASPDNFTLPQWQQAQRFGLHPSEIKQAFRNAWAQSDDVKSMAAAMQAQGYALAKGDRRGFVVVDIYGEVYSLPKWLDLKTREVKAKLGDPKALPTVEAAAYSLKSRVSNRLSELLDSIAQRQGQELAPMTARKQSLTQDQRIQRTNLNEYQAERHAWETLARAEKFRDGWRGLWDRITGRYARLRRENELELAECQKRDRNEREALFKRQLSERRSIQKQIADLRARHVAERKRLHALAADYLKSELSAVPPRRTRAVQPSLNL